MVDNFTLMRVKLLCNDIQMEIEMANSLLSSFDTVACGVFMSLKFFYIVIASI